MHRLEAVAFLLSINTLWTVIFLQQVHAEGIPSFDNNFEIKVDGSISELQLLSGIDTIVAAQQEQYTMITTTSTIQNNARALEDALEEDISDSLVTDDSVVQILYNEDFLQCNYETMQFYQENPFINKAVRDFGDSAIASRSGANNLNLTLQFNETMKDRMKQACKNEPNPNFNYTSSGIPGMYAFAGDLNCTYNIQGGETVTTSIINYANCVADTEACNAVDETDFLRIVMHSLGSACDGLQREEEIIRFSGGALVFRQVTAWTAIAIGIGLAIFIELG